MRYFLSYSPDGTESIKAALVLLFEQANSLQSNIKEELQ